MDDKFIQSYLQCIGQVKPTKNIVKENAKPKSKKKLIKEQAEDTYDMTLTIEDPRWNEDDEDYEEYDSFDAIAKHLLETLPEQDWYKMLESFGGKVVGEGHDSGGPISNVGDLCFDIVFKGITKDQLFELMQKELYNDWSVFDWCTLNLDVDGDAGSTPDSLVETLQQLADDPDCVVVQAFSPSAGVDDEHTNLDAPENPDDI